MGLKEIVNPLELLRKLSETPSPSGEEDELAKLVVELMEEIGLEAEILEWKGTQNILLNCEAPFWIITHLDTVEGISKFRVEGNRAFGTGVCDAKASIVAILLALRSIGDERNLNFGVALLSDEEEEGRGAELIAREFSSRKCLVMEPTSLRICRRNFGSLTLKARFEGITAHASMPEVGENPIEEALNFLLSLRKRLRAREIKLVPMEFSSNKENYRLPREAQIEVELVLPPEENPKILFEEISREFSRDRVSITGEDCTHGFKSRESHMYLERALERSGLEIRYWEMPSTTDANFLWERGWDPVVWGPGFLGDCHTPRESVSIVEIDEASKVLFNLNSIVSEIRFSRE